MSSIDRYKFKDSIERNQYYNYILKFVTRDKSSSNEDLCFLLEQIELSTPKDDNVTFNLCKLISTLHSIILSKLLTNGYVKFQVKLVELADRYRSNLDTTKLSSKNVFTNEKKLAVICLNSIFLKFGGFLNSFKLNLLTISYKHLKKLDDNSTRDANYFNQFLILIDTLLNSNPNLDFKIFQRLLKLYKLIGSKGKAYSIEKENYSYPILSVIYVNNILTTLLRSPYYINSITTKKSQQNPLHYLNSISTYLTYLVSCTDTRYKNLRLSTTKNITNLLIFSYINYGTEENETKVFNFIFNYLWDKYLQINNNNKVKVAIIEILMQLVSSLNLVFETGILPNSRNFISFKSFEILNLSIEKIFSDKPVDGVLAIENGTAFNTATIILNHINIFFQHILDEVRSDVNKLIILQYLFEEHLNPKETSNSYKVIAFLQLSQLIISDLDQYILTHDSSKMEETLLYYLQNQNPYIRILAIQTLTKLNVDTDKIISKSFNDLKELISSSAAVHASKDTFIESHSKALLTASILSSLHSISTDSVLSILSMSNSILKKFNSNVLINNLINGNDFSTLSNTNYEKQISSWILMMGLFNYYQRQKNPFLLGNNPLLNIWKTLLAHNVPSNFIKIENGRITNFNELMKFIEIKNYSLGCLVCFVDYAISLSSMPPDFAKQLTPLLTKCYSFIMNIEAQLGSSIPTQLFKTMQIQKLRILTNMVKIIPHIIKLTDEVNISTDLLVSVVKNFNDYKLFNYKLAVDNNNSKSKVVKEPSEYDIYQVDDGLAFGLTSKINLFQVDELLFKNEPVSFNGKNEDAFEIDTVSNSSDFIIERKDCKSNLSYISKFDHLEALLFQPIQGSIMNDYLFTLISNSKFYSNSKKDVVPVDTAIIDLSLELFQLVFPYLSLKIQQSILEHIRTGILHSPELITKAATSDTVQNDSFNYERQKLVIVNSSVALHGMLNHLNMKDASHLKLNRMIVNLILETLKRVSTNDLITININAESVGLCLTVLDDDNIKLTSESLSFFINAIVENNDPYNRVFGALCLANIFKFNSRSTNLGTILDVLFKLALDPHPIVHHWTLESLILIFENYHNYSGSRSLIDELIDILNKIYSDDDFGLQSKSIISSNFNLSFEGGDKNVLLSKFARVIIKVVGPGIQVLPERSKLESLILQLLLLTTTNFDLVSREMIVLIDELSIFDKNLIGDEIFHKFLKFLYSTNIKTGVYNENLVMLPFIDNIIEAEETGHEVFPITSSDILLKLAVSSLLQIVRVSTSVSSLYETLDLDLQNIVWILLESNNTEVFKIFKLWIDLDFTTKQNNESKIKWVEDLIGKFGYTEKELYKPLNNQFKERFNATVSLFSGKLKSTISAKQAGEESRSFALTSKDLRGDYDDDDDDDESIASEDANVMNNGAEDATPSESRFDEEEVDDNNNNVEVKGAKAQKISDEEPVRWQFKLKTLKLLSQILAYAKDDEFLFKYLSTRLSELVRLSFIASTSQILELRFLGLKLLGQILQDYSHLKDPLYEHLSILDQQQAQIISAILPLFGEDSSIDLICEGFNIASILIGCRITSLSRLQRLVKILVTSLHDLSLLKANKKSDTSLKIGEVLVKSSKEQDRLTLAILNSWAVLQNQCDLEDTDLTDLINEHLKMLSTLWIYSLKQYAILKYGKEFAQSDFLSIESYEQYWNNIVTATSLVIKNELDLISGILGDELNNFFFTIFAQCLEILFKSSYSNVEILNVLRNILTLRSSSKIIYHDLVFEEVVDLFNRLSLNSDNQQKLILIDIIRELYMSYFDNGLGESRSEQDMHNDVDKLFELLRLVMSPVNKILPFIRDKEILPEKLSSFSESDLNILKKLFSGFLLMLAMLPSVIQIDLYSCLLFLFSLIYQLDNNEIISIVLPNLKKVLNELSLNDQHALLSKFYQSIEPVILQNQSQNSLITYMIFATTTTSNLIMRDEDYQHISKLLISSLQKQDTLAIAIRSIKTLMVQHENVNACYILKFLIPILVECVIEQELEEPRIGIELLIIFAKNNAEEKFISSLMLIIPLLLWFSPKDKNYVNTKMMDLIQFEPEGFKKFVSGHLTEDEKKSIEEIVKYKHDTALNNGSQEHISLKMFGE